ncbi:hypothetical protein ASD50_21965 [Mesorhizobium sp. Root552]|jgi:hypothetical protein|uniref:hypothetical protein n=1 Tax=Mesorhizobium sp. Root552 TaxID=1736555 RepID=UPI000701D055|nr:hypothetical protein [Mesorhizobium sp. Root552]KQZ18677.1 hypothetical protein ASD50_21965 [Mesorhizobium sp. Root552]
MLVGANKDMLTDPVFVRASMRALVERNYFARRTGVNQHGMGTLDRRAKGALTHSRCGHIHLVKVDVESLDTAAVTSQSIHQSQDVL